MSMSNIFEADFNFKSNHSLDTQITASIDRGDFHLSLLSLISLIVWTIYVLFYNSRVVGLIVSVIIRRFVKSCYISIGSISLSVLGGKLMLRDFVYVQDDFSIRLCYAVVVFNYWTRYYPERKDIFQKRCLHVYLYGVDVHLFNRTSVYNMLRSIFKPDSYQSSEFLCRFASVTGTSKETSKLITSEEQNRHRNVTSSEQEISNSASNSGVLDTFWSHAHKLIPAIRFDLELTNICAGNHLLPRACLLTCNRIYGSYSTSDASSQFDKYQHQVKARFINLMGSLVLVSKYSGQHAVEDPPKSWDKAFHVFHFGEGTIEYILDEPGLATSETQKIELPEDNIAVQKSWPKWELHVNVNKVCQLNYGPWADRQRDIIWRFFFPSSYQIAKPSKPVIIGQPRVAKKFIFELQTSTNINLNVYFMRQNVVESLTLSGLPNSVIKLSIPWLVGRNGFVTTLHINLVKGNLITEHLWRNLLTSNQYVNLDLKMQYPREWNMRQLWDITLDTRDAQLTILFDYKHYFKGLIDDWIRGSHPDLLSFVPCTYKFHIKSNNMDLILLANDYNWISEYGENAHLAFHAKKLSLTFDLPFVDFLPTTVPIIYSIEGSSVSLRFSIPETSTLYYLVQEVHNRLKFVNGRGQLQKSSPFHSSTQEMTFPKSGSKTISLQWFDCGWAPRISIRIAYVYHPSPWVSEYWRFLPPEFKLNVLALKGLSSTASSNQSSRKLNVTKRTAALSQQNTESAGQSDLEELALQKLRPEGSHTQGPTENDILQSKFDVYSALEPDTVDLHLHIPSAQLLFYGTLLRHFIHVKENYFGCHQIPVSFDREPLQPEESSSLTDDDLIRLKSRTRCQAKDEDLSKASKLPEKRIIDPRDCRPLSVRVSLEFHNTQVHLPMHGSSNESPCPTAFLDCFGFEMDKRWHETKLQLLFSPILICLYDQNKDFRSKSTSNVSSSRIQLVGLQLRGQGMFSHVDLPIRSESLEYAWLLELTVGQLTGQLSAPKMACLIQCLKEFVFSAVDSENQLVSSRAFELCQHGRPQQLCPFWHKICPTTLCPSDMQLKYRMFRLTVDAIDLSIVENRNCLCIQFDPIRLAHCNRHSATHCDGMFMLLPDVRLIQLVAPLATEVKDHFNPNSQFINTKQAENSVLWFEAGSFSLGPVHVNLSRSPEKRDHLNWQLEFLKLHDLTTKRLSFLWSGNNDVINGTLRNASLNSRHTTKSFDVFYSGENKLIMRKPLPGYVAPDIIPNCGCYGQCSFFGQNENGRILFNELLTGDFGQRTVFPSRSTYKPDLFMPINNNCKTEIQSTSMSDPFVVNQKMSTSNVADCSSRNLGFGESLLMANCLLHELHSSHECRERYNGLLLMREEVILAYLEAGNQKGMDWCLMHFCEEEDQSDTDSTKSSNSLGTYASFDSSSKLEQLIKYDSDASDMDLNIRDVKNLLKDPFTLSDQLNKKNCIDQSSDMKTKSSWPEINISQRTKPSSLSDLLVPIVPNDSGECNKMDENKELSGAANAKSVTKKLSYLPSNLSLDSLIELPANSSTSSSSSCSILAPSNIDQSHTENIHFASSCRKSFSNQKSPPTPPPRKFVKDHCTSEIKQNEMHETDVLTQDKDSNTEPRISNGEKKDYDDAFENFVDLRTQLNRPISESGLLRPAYGRHLSAYKCVAGLTCPSNLRNRWHVCKHIHPGNACPRSLDNLLKGDKNTYINHLKSHRHQNMTIFNHLRQCQPKVAMAPRFQIRHTGFSSQSITVRSNSTSTRSDIPPSNLSALPHEESHYDAESVATTIKSKAIVWLQGPVNLLLTPLLTESLERYIKILIPVVKTISPSSIVDSMHCKCVKSMEHQIKPLLSSAHSLTSKIQNKAGQNEKLLKLSHPLSADKSSSCNPAANEERQSILQNLLGNRSTQEAVSHQNVASKPFRIRKMSADYELMSNSQDTIKSTKNTSDVSKPLHSVAELPNDHSEGNFALSELLSSVPMISQGIVAGSCRPSLSSKVAALSVERINISFLQLYAVEDLVHLDSLRSGLHDLTCVSLMTFCVDSFSFELMASYKRESLAGKFNDSYIQDQPNSISTPGSNISNRPFVASSTVESGHQTIRPPSTVNAQNNMERQEDNVSTNVMSSNIHDILNICPSLPEQYSCNPVNRNEIVNNSFPGRVKHKRQPSCPHMLFSFPDLSQSYEMVTQSSEPVIRKSTKRYDNTLTDSRYNAYKDGEKSQNVKEGTCTKIVHSNSFNNDTNNTKLPSVEFISSQSDRKNTRKIDDTVDSNNVRPTTTEPNDNLQNSCDCEHLGSELVCQVTVHRLHGQLRRLTRYSQFNADVLLTAIPFESSRAFFSFTSDPHSSNLSPVNDISCTSQFFEEQSFGWIMFECGLEGLSFCWVQRSEFPDSVSAVQNTKVTSTEEHPKDAYNESTASVHNTSPQPPPVNSSTSREAYRVNGLSSKLRVNTVWLNFAAPKRLPNKRRIELIRSDWNLLSTAAPTIRAWIDPCNRLVSICKQFHLSSERRLLAVISCLMTEVVNPRSDVLNSDHKRCPRSIGNKVQLVMNTNDLDGYARHRTETAHILRFDPSCQLLVVLRRYLLEMNNHYGVTKADELLAEMLKDSVVPQNEFLQRGILSLTREWRFLVDSLAISVSDLRASRECTIPSVPLDTNYAVDFRQIDLEEPVFAGIGIPRAGSVFTTHDYQVEASDSVQPVTVGKTAHQKTGNYFAAPSPAVTSRLLKMVVGSLSPTSPHPVRYGSVNIEDGLQSSNNIGTNSGVCRKQLDDLFFSVDKTVGHVQGQNKLDDDLYNQPDEAYWDASDQLSESITDTNDPLVRNPIMKRFLQDARANIMEHPQTSEVASLAQRPTANITDHNLHNNIDTSNANRLSSSSTVDAKVCESDTFEKTLSENSNPKVSVTKPTKYTKEQRVPTNVNFDHSFTADCKITAADFEQAAHLSAQYRYVAYIQSLFSPLLESVGLSVKGIRRTTLMKKFDGFLSVEGLLQTFQIEIVSSARNPMVHSLTKQPVSEQANDSGNPKSHSRIFGQQTTFQRQLAFLCCNFASSLILRDIVDYKSSNSTRLRKQTTSQLSQIQTTTKMDVILHIDFIRQHVNLSLLRLVHQFVTMIYCARDTCKSVSNDQSIDPAVPSPIGVWPQKHDSKGSSDDTDGTYRSRSSAYVRFGEESVGSGRSTQGEQLKSKNKYENLTNNEEQYSTFAVEPDRSSAENTSNSSADKDLLIITNPVNSHEIVTTMPSFSLLPTSRTSDFDDSSLSALRSPGNHAGNSFCSPPSCWRRLANYVELYSTVPKTKTVIRKPLSTSIPTMAMPTITEEDRDHNVMCVSESSKVKNSLPAMSHPKQQHSPSPSGLNSPTGNKVILFSRKTFPTVTYRVLNEERDNDQTGVMPKDASYQNTKSSITSQWNPSVQTFVSRHSGTVGGDKIQSILHDLTKSDQQCKYPFIGLTDTSSKKENAISGCGLEQFTYPWVLGERVPLVVFVTAKIRQMAVSAVLSELNLNAGVRNVHGSFTLTNQIRGHGSFSEKFVTHSSNLHCGDCSIQLTEKLPLKVQEVVCVKAGRSHAMLSCSRTSQTERNACVISLGRIMVTLPHHPVRLHGVMQRQAKRISSTVYELLRNPNAGYTHIHSWRSSGSRIATTPTTCSTTTTASDPSNNLKSSHQPTTEPAQIAVTNAKKISQSPPLKFNLLAVSQGLTVNVALHSTLQAVYHIDPVYVSGQLGTRSYVDISITDHSLTLKSVRPPANFPTSISLPFPRILASIVQRVSSGGRYARGQRKEPILTYGLEAEQGLYMDIQIHIDTLEQNLTTDMLNYIMVVVKLFMKEINEVIQKMAGEERPRLRKPLKFSHNPMSQTDDSTRLNVSGAQSHPNGDWILSRAARGRTKFTIKIRMKEIQLLASTKNGAIKLEARKIEVELTNRVSQTHLINNRNIGTFHAFNDSHVLPSHGLSQKRPSNLNIHSNNSGHFMESGWKSSMGSSSYDSLFIYATIANVGLDLGYFDQDTFHALSPDFQNVAFFRTSIALRSLLAEEKFTPSQNAESCTSNVSRGEQDAFLISLNRPIIWLKPFTFDRGIMMWMVYRDEFAKWNEHIEHLASMAPQEEDVETVRIRSGLVHGTHHSTDHSVKDRSQNIFAPSPPSYSSLHPTNGAYMNDIPDVTIASNPSVNVNKTSSTLFLQLSIEDLGVCLPIHMIKLPSQSLKCDSRTALVLTLDKSRISACFHDSLVSQGEFTDFCLRFDDEFNVGSDDWKPDKKRSTIEVKGKRCVVILNACIVPSGTFSVYWRDLEKRGQCHLTIQWQMRGLDFHLDDSIGRRLKALFTILTRMTGYNGAAPLLPTSGEEEEEDEDNGSPSRDFLETEEIQRVQSSENSQQTYQYPVSTEKRSSTVSATLSKKLSNDVDIASLDRYRPLIMSKESDVKNTLDSSHFRSMEFHKQKLDLSDAQAFKRQKWNTLRKKKSRGVVLRATNSSSTDQCVNEYNLANTQSPGCQSIPTDRKLFNTCVRSSSSVTEDFPPSRTQRSSDIPLRRFSNVPSISPNYITKIDSVYFDAEDIIPYNTVAKNISSPKMVKNAEMKSDAVSQHNNNRYFDEYSDDWCDPNRSLDVDDELYHDVDEQNTIDSDNADSLYTTRTIPTVGIDVDHLRSNVRPPTPPPRKSHNLREEIQFRSSVEQSSGQQAVSTVAANTPQEEPKLQLELDVQIHVDSGCCVLHPRLSSHFMPDDNAAKQSATIMLSPGVGINPFGVSDNVKLLSPDSRFQTIGACATNHIESGYRFSYSDLLPGYLERYRRQLLQDSQIVSNDISVFYLPAVDVSLHYNSMTELDFLPGSGAFGVPNPVVPLTELAPNLQTLSSNVITTRSPSQPRNSQSTGNKDDSTPRLNISSPRSIRKQADLYVSCFLQKLPKELVVQPSLLDFLEQAIDNLPFVADWNSEADSVSSDSGNEVFFEKFPVHAIVHLHVQPSTIRFLCLPTSRMQCLMVLPFLDAVFSTKRDDCDSVVNRVDNNVSRKLTDLASLQSDNQEDITGFTLKPKLVVGDIVSAGGLSVTAILKEFRVSIFHPYGESSSMRPESSSWGNARPCDSLTILVKDIQCHFSRTIEAKIVQMNPNVPTNECTTAAVSEPNKKPSSSAVHGVSLLSSASETMNSTQSGDNFGLHRNLYISGIFDIGVAEFTCDTRRTLEILDIYNSWYRSSLARRLFLGNDDLTDTADNATQPFDQSEVQEVAQQQSNAKSETVSDTIDTAATLNTIQSPKTSVGCESDYESQRDTVKPTTESQQLSIKTKKQPSSKTITLKETHCHTNCTRLNEARATTIGPCFSSNDHSTLAPTNSTSPDPTSKLTTLVGIERGASGSRNTSLRVASWNALTIFCVQLKKFDLNLYMGSAMGLTRLIVDQSFCEGHISVNSSGRKHTLLTAGLANSQFISEGGGVGGEFGLVDVEARLRIDDDPSHDPQHCLAAQVGGFQIRIEYMNTNILLFRVNSLDLMLYDEWRLKDVAQQLFDSGRQAKSVPVKQSQYTSLESDSESNIAFGSPPIFIRIAGEINWDQAQAAIVRSTTPDLLRSIHKVRDYFQEQVREGRLSLIGQVGRFGMFPMTSRQRRSSSQSMSFCSPARFQGKLDTKSDSFGDQEIDRLLQRHWQKIMYQALKLFSRERFRVSNLKGKSISVESQSDSHNNPVLSGSFQLSGNSLGIACFAGSFRSAPDWAVFNIQYPTACFETEAQRELPMVDEEMNLDLSEVDGWINVRQVLSFELGSPPEFQPQMAYVLRVRRGKPQNLKDLPIATIEEWLEFSFRGADNTVVNFVRHSNPSGVSSVIQLAHFPVSFSQINSQESSLPAFNVLNSTKSGQSVICPTRDVLTPVNEDDNNPLESGNNNRATTNTGNNESVNVGKDLLKEERPSVSVRSNPLKPPNEGELLFILPSLALRITTDQRQTMSRPTLSSLPSVVPTSLTANEPKSDNTSKNVNRTNSLVRHSKGSLLLPQSKPSSKKDNSGDVYVNSPSSVPSVKVSFQTDFHGFVQLGLIDVPWLPSLISSYLDERLNDYELSSAASWNANDINQSHSNATFRTDVISEDIISRLRALSTTSSPMVQDARVYDIIHWSLSPECRWLLATNIGVPAFDRLLESVGFRKARVTIPKWLQRGIMDQLDNIASILLEGSLQLSMDEINEESKTSHQKK